MAHYNLIGLCPSTHQIKTGWNVASSAQRLKKKTDSHEDEFWALSDTPLFNCDKPLARFRHPSFALPGSDGTQPRWAIEDKSSIEPVPQPLNLIAGDATESLALDLVVFEQSQSSKLSLN